MRIILALLLVSLLSGCIAEDQGGSNGTSTSSSSTSSGDQKMPTETMYSCTSSVGSEVVTLSVAGENIGGCPLTTLSKDSTLSSAEIASGCTVQYDMDGDSLADGEAVVGSKYNSGTSLTAFCGAGTLESTITIGLTA